MMLHRSVLLILLSILFLLPTKSFGHGLGKQVLEQEVAGPYLVSAWIEPETIRAGEEMHTTVSIQSETGTEFVTLATVTLSALHRDQAVASSTTEATHDRASNPLFYEGTLVLDPAGQWMVTITIENEGTTADVSFSVDAKTESQDEDSVGWQQIGQVIGLIGIGVVMLGIVFQALRQRVKE